MPFLTGPREICVALLLLSAAGGATAEVLPLRVVRPEPTRILVEYAAHLAPDDTPDVTVVTSESVYPDVEATVTSDAVVVSLSPTISDALDAGVATGRPVPAFLIIRELTLGGRVHSNLIARLPVTFEARLDGDVWYTTRLNVDYLPPVHRERSRRPDAWVVHIDGHRFLVANVRAQFSPTGDTRRSLLQQTPFIELTLDGVVPYRARATVSFVERTDAEPQLLASGVTPHAPAGRLANFLSDLDVYTGFMFTNTAGTDPTFGLDARFQRPFLFAAFGQRIQISIGPRATLRTNSLDQDDENSILLSAPVEIRSFRGPLTLRDRAEAPLINTIAFAIGPTLEAEKSFRNRNLVSDGQLSFWFSTLGASGLSGTLSGYAFDVRPYFGFETGRNVGSRLADSTTDSIGRLKAGFSFKFQLEFDQPHLHAIVFDVDYVYRRLYTEETAGRWRSTGAHAVAPSATVEGTAREQSAASRTLYIRADANSRNYAHAALRFVFSRYWEVFASYARGGLPPRFISVDKFQAGFAFRLGAP